jgi:hypothetical protein
MNRKLVGVSVGTFVAVGLGAALSAYLSAPVVKGYRSEDRAALNAFVEKELNTWFAGKRLADAFASKR